MENLWVGGNLSMANQMRGGGEEDRDKSGARLLFSLTKAIYVYIYPAIKIF